MNENITFRLKEAIKEERPSLVWKKINGIDTPCAQIDLSSYGNNFDTLLLSPTSTEEADLLSEPLKATWKRQFDETNSDKWFDGSRFINFYKKYPFTFKGLPSAALEDIPFVGFMFAGSLLKGGLTTPAGSRILTLDRVSPESVHSHGLAVAPNLRRLGIASRLVEYSLLMLNQYKIGSRLVWDTNENDIQVSGGWSPVPLWQNYGTNFGRMKNYGSVDSSVGDGIFFFANIQDLSNRIQQDKTWSGWMKSLNENQLTK